MISYLYYYNSMFYNMWHVGGLVVIIIPTYNYCYYIILKLNKYV